MLQQTQVNTVIDYYKKFIRRFPDIGRLARANLQTVLKAWEGMGYYARARNLHRAAKEVLSRHNGAVPDIYDDFRQLPGVGDYIAAAVMSIAFDRPLAVVDGNVKRVLARLYCMDLPVNKTPHHKDFKEKADKLLEAKSPGTFNQAVMELGALVCTPKNPGCTTCPIRIHCKAFQTQTVASYPKREKTTPTPRYHIAVGIVQKKNRFLITRRKPEGLLGGLWEFPGGKVGKKETAEAACVREIKEETNLSVQIESHLTRVNHAYTHFKIVMDVYCCTYLSGRIKLSGPVDFRWITLDEIERHPFPKANHKFIPQLKQVFGL